MNVFRSTRSSIGLQAELRAAVTSYARQLRSDGVPCERVLVQVKAAVRAATPPDVYAFEMRGLVDDVVRWCVDAYYDGT